MEPVREEDAPITYSISFTTTFFPPKPGEFIVLKETSFPATDLALNLGTYHSRLPDLDLMVHSDVPFKVSDTSDVNILIGDHTIPLFKINEQGIGMKIMKRQFLTKNCKVEQYDDRTFVLVSQDYNTQTFEYKRQVCSVCQAEYTLKALHCDSDDHLSQYYLKRLTSSDRTLTVTQLTANLFFNPRFSMVQKWSPQYEGEAHPLNLYSSVDDIYDWISIVVLHANPDLQLETSRQSHCYKNGINRIMIDGQTIKQGANKGNTELVSLSKEPFEGLVPVLYEVKKRETGTRLFLKQILHIIRGIDEKTELEDLSPAGSAPSSNAKIVHDNKPLGRNYLKTPNEEEKATYNRKVLLALEKMCTPQGIRHTSVNQVVLEHNLDEESIRYLKRNLGTLTSPDTKENYVDKMLLCTFLELTVNNKNQMGYISKAPLVGLTNVPDSNLSRAHINITSATLGRLNIKPGNNIVLATSTGKLSGSLELPGDRSSTFILYEDPSKIDQWANVNVYKQDNRFLTYAYFTTLNLVKSKGLLDYLFPDTYDGPNNPTDLPKYFQDELTPNQKVAVQKAMQHSPCLPNIITGPAGCGKTKVLMEIMLQTISKNDNKGRVLIINPTNIGVVGLYKRAKEIIPQHFSDVQVIKVTSPTQLISEDCKDCFKNSQGTHHEYPDPTDILRHQVACCTPTIALRIGLLSTHSVCFDTILVDECCYEPQPGSLSAILPFLTRTGPNPRVILAGDPNQLNYCARSLGAKMGGYQTDLLSRLLNRPVYKTDMLVSNLNENFRNGEIFVEIINTLVYNNKIVPMILTNRGRMSVVHSAGLTKRAANDKSSYNLVEAVQSLSQARAYRAKNPGRGIVILTMYKAQLAMLTKLQENTPPENRIQVVTSESIQGSQSECIVICTSINGDYPNHKGAYNWTGNIQRLCMSISRAIRDLIIVGNILLLNRIPAYNFLIRIAERSRTLACPPHILQLVKQDR